MTHKFMRTQANWSPLNSHAPKTLKPRIRHPKFPPERRTCHEKWSGERTHYFKEVGMLTQHPGLYQRPLTQNYFFLYPGRPKKRNPELKPRPQAPSPTPRTLSLFLPSPQPTTLPRPPRTCNVCETACECLLVCFGNLLGLGGLGLRTQGLGLGALGFEAFGA